MHKMHKMYTADDVAFFVVEIMRLQELGLLSKPLRINKLTVVEYRFLHQLVQEVNLRVLENIHDD